MPGFGSVEESAFGGAVVELFEFSRGGKKYRYTSHDEGVTIAGGAVFSPLGISSPKITRSHNIDDSSVEVAIPKTCELATHLKIAPNAAICHLQILRKHLSDAEVINTFKGVVSGTRIVKGQLKLKVESLLAASSGIGLRRLYSKACSHTLYGDRCTLISGNFSATTTVDSIAGDIVTASGLTEAAGAYLGGWIEWSVAEAGITDRGWINAHAAGGVLTLAYAPLSLTAGATITAFQGCDRTLAACIAKSNKLNYGGFVYAPDKNPWGGTTIF